MVAIEVLQEGRVGEEGPGDPTTVLRTVPGPVNEILVSTTHPADIQDFVHFPGLVTVDESFWRRRWLGGNRQGTGKGRFDLGNMKDWMDFKGGREGETHCTGVYNFVNGEWTDKARSEFLRGTRDWEVTSLEHDRLTDLVLRCWNSLSISRPDGTVPRTKEGGTCFPPDSLAAEDLVTDGGNGGIGFLRGEERWLISKGALERGES